MANSEIWLSMPSLSTTHLLKYTFNIFFLYIVTHFQKKNIVTKCIINPFLFPENFYRLIPLMTWVARVVHRNNVSLNHVVQSILATEICSAVFTRSVESNICTLHHSNTEISLKLKRVTPFGFLIVRQYNRLYTVP